MCEYALVSRFIILYKWNNVASLLGNVEINFPQIQKDALYTAIIRGYSGTLFTIGYIHYSVIR